MPVRATKRGVERTPLERRLRRPRLRRELRRPRRRAASCGSGARVLVIDRYEVGERQTSRVRGADRVARRTSGSRTRSARPSATLVVHTPDARRSAGRCRGRSRPSTTASCARCWARRRRRRLRDGEGRRAHAGRHRPHRPRRPARAARRRRARLAARALGRAERDPAARGAALARPRGPPARHGARPRAVARPAYVRAGYSWSFPAGDELRVGVGSFDPRDHVKEPTVRLAGDLGVPAERYQGNWIPHQLRARPRTASSSPATAPATACRRPPRASARRSTSAWPAGASCARVVEGRQTREQALARYAAFCEEHRRAVPLAAARPAARRSSTRA